MSPFRYAHAAHHDWRDALAQVIDGLGLNAGNLGFVYLTDPLEPYLEEILERLREATEVEHWVGTVGIGICATGVEYYQRPAIAAMVADLPPESFQVFGPITDQGFDDFDRALRQWLPNGQPFLGVVHGDPGNAETEEALEQLAARTSTGFLVGGLASSRDQARVIADEVIADGLSGVMFTESVEVLTALTQGCSPIGPQHEITESQRNILVRLDGEPALEIFKQDIGPDLSGKLSKLGGLIFAGLPIPASDTGDYLVRNLVGLDIERKLLAIGELVETGQQVMFCRRDLETAREDLSRMIRKLKSRLPGPPRGGIYVSCLGRGASLFGEESEELRQIQEELGDFPLVGFYANGEISQDRLYGYTGVLTLFV